MWYFLFFKHRGKYQNIKKGHNLKTRIPTMARATVIVIYGRVSCVCVCVCVNPKPKPTMARATVIVIYGRFLPRIWTVTNRDLWQCFAPYLWQGFAPYLILPQWMCHELLVNLVNGNGGNDTCPCNRDLWEAFCLRRGFWGFCSFYFILLLFYDRLFAPDEDSEDFFSWGLKRGGKQDWVLFNGPLSKNQSFFGGRRVKVWKYDEASTSRVSVSLVSCPERETERERVMSRERERERERERSLLTITWMTEETEREREKFNWQSRSDWSDWRRVGGRERERHTQREQFIDNQIDDWRSVSTTPLQGDTAAGQ